MMDRDEWRAAVLRFAAKVQPLPRESWQRIAIALLAAKQRSDKDKAS